MRLLSTPALALLACWPAAAQTYTISTFAGGALPVNIAGTSVNLAGSAVQLAVDAAGDVYFVYQHSILRLDAVSGQLTVAAGNGTVGFSGDNGPAASAQLNSPEGLAIDSVGNLYIADTYNNRIRKVANGIITTVAGGGNQGLGDNGPATAAQLNNPFGVAVDSSGDIYIADTLFQRIRAVVNGTIATVAGNGTQGYSGDTGPATSAELNYPYGVVLDGAGNLYIADSNNMRIREVSGGVITTVAGNGTQGYSGDNGPAASAEINYPYGVAFDAHRNLYIADYGNGSVREVTGGVISTVAGISDRYGFSGDGGPATSALLLGPWSVGLDANGNLYIADAPNHRVRKVANGIINTVAGGGPPLGDGGPATSAQLEFPRCAAVDSQGALYVCDFQGNRVRKIANGVITTLAGNGTGGFSGDGGPAASAELNEPAGIAIDSSGNVYIADQLNQRVRKVANGIITTVAGTGTAGFSGDNGPATSAKLSYPTALALDSNGNLYIADYANERIRMISGGVITTVAGNGTAGYSGDNGAATSAELHFPYGLAVDSANNLYISDYDNGRVREVSGGTITTVVGSALSGFGGDNGPATSAKLDGPSAIGFDAAGNLHILDYYNNRVRMVSNGVINTIAGGGTQFGDNGAATLAQFDAPFGMAVAPAGNVYLSDTSDNRIRLISALAAGLTITSSHTGNFAPGENGATYTLTVSNTVPSGATAGTVSVTDTPPAGLTLVSLSGTGWTCASATCTRGDILEPGSSYPAITVTVNVASGAPAQVTNQASISGGGSSGATASDPTNIVAPPPPAAVTVFAPAQGAAGVSITTPLSWTAPSGATSYSVYFGTTTPPPQVIASTTATTYSATLLPSTTYYWSVTAINGNGSTPSAVWSFSTAAPPTFPTYTISTFAGGALPVNLVGTAASLNGTLDPMAVDSAGNTYFTYQNCIWRLDAVTGILSLIAGNGIQGYAGDNGPATSAEFSYPYGIAVDSAGNVYVGDSDNERVRKISNGIITTIAGTGTQGFSGDNGPATAAELNLPTGLAFDASGNLYIADADNGRVRMVANGIITTVVGGGSTLGDGGPAASARLQNPYGLAFDKLGNLYIADGGAYRIREVSSGVINTVAGNGTYGYSGDNGPATAAQLYTPHGVAVDGAGNLYIADSQNYCIRKVTAGTITTVAGTPSVYGFGGDNGPATSALLDYPWGVGVDGAGNLYISDTDNYRLRKVTNGIIATIAGGGPPLGDGGPPTGAQLASPAGAAVDSQGNLYFADDENNRIRKIANGVITTLAGNGTPGFSGDNGPATAAELNAPRAVAVDSAGNLYIADAGNNRIRKVANGVITTLAGTGVSGYTGDNGPATSAEISNPVAIVVDPSGNVYYSDANYDRIREISNGIITTAVGAGTAGFSGDGGPASSAQFSYSYGMTVDSAGNLYFADYLNARIRKVTNGVISTIAGNGKVGFSGDNGPATAAEFSEPWAVALDAAGNLYVDDYGNHRIRMIAGGFVTSIAGGGTQFGDGGPATSSVVIYDGGIAADPHGNLYLSDVSDNRIRLLSSLPAELSISSSHTGSFAQGQSGTYTVTVADAAFQGATSGLITVSDTLPTGLTLSAMSGTGWSCTGNSCSRSDALEPGSSYPPITVTVNVAANAASPVTNQVSVAGGGSIPASANDPTVITAGQLPAAVTVFSPAQAASSIAVTASLTWTAPAGATSYAVYFGTSTPPPLAVSRTTALSYSPALASGTTYYWSVSAVNTYGATPSAVWSFTTALPATAGYRFVPVAPCRVMDTRNAAGTFGGPSLAAAATRTLPIPQSACNIPSTAVAYSLNITVVPPGPLTYLSVWPHGQAQPVVSTLNSFDGRVVANAAIVPAGASGGIDLYASNATDAIVDINGYFAPASAAGSMSFYTATPCRVVDTRNGSGPFGGPYMSGGLTRSFAIPSSACGIPATAQAYALNVTVVPHTGLSYLTLWPSGQTQPYVSTLNSFDGSVVANAAIVPAGSGGAVSAYVTNDTDVIIDINGYFAPPGSTGALSLYTLTPCRVADTRNAAGAFGGPSLAANGTRTFAIPASACSVPATAQAYSLNVTVVPPGPLTYLTAWPAGEAQPNVSTLNSFYGKVVANAAIVPAGSAGAVSLFASNATDAILDINAYFAQ